MPAGLLARYQLYDAWFNSKCAYPDGTSCGNQTWADVITDVDDTADANGNNGDVYWSVSDFCHGRESLHHG
jgi:hypothetical protein